MTEPSYIFPSIAIPEPTKVPDGFESSSNKTNPSVKPNVNQERSHNKRTGVRQAVLTYHKSAIQEKLKKNFPLKFVALHCIFLCFMAAIAFAFQSLQFVYKYNLYFVSSGFW